MRYNISCTISKPIEKSRIINKVHNIKEINIRVANNVDYYLL